MEINEKRGLSSSNLHIIAMALMLCDHMWATVISGHEWLTAIGRLAFPIFAFMLAQGFRHTKSVGRYALRMFLFALVSEVPFDLMSGGTWFYPFHQNVMWTFLISLGCMELISLSRRTKKPVLIGLVTLLTACAGWFVGRIAMVDYGGEGVLTVLMFYLLPGDALWQKVLQVIIMAVINFRLLASYYVPVEIAGRVFDLPEQGLAVLALAFIWLYNGRRGNTSRPWQMFCYAFYPLHMLVLAGIMLNR